MREFAFLIACLTVAPPVAADGISDYVTIGGEFRPRFAAMHNFNLNRNAPDENEAVFMRSRIRFDFDPIDRVFIRLSLQDVRRWGDPTSNASATTDVADITLREGYAEFSDVLGGHVDVRLGRQAIILGSERVFGDLDWHRIGLTHDAAVTTLRFGSEHSIDALWIGVSEADNVGTTNATKGGVDADGWLTGLYGHLKVKPFTRFEPYWITQDYDSTTLTTLIPAPTSSGVVDGDLQIHTFGLNLAGALGDRWSWDAEGNAQMGSLGSRDVRAWMAHGGITFEPRFRKLTRVGAAYDHYSGDRTRNDREIGTYFPVFPSYYEHMGLIGRVGMRNISRWRVTAGGELIADWSWRFDWHHFQLASRADHVYAVSNATAFATGGAVSSSSVGDEYDLVFTYPWNRNVTLLASGSLFDPGAAIDQVVASSNSIKNLVAQVEVKF